MLEGLSELTDDQAVELLQAVLENLTERHPVVREAAQCLIFKAEEQLRLKTAAAKVAIFRARRAYLKELCEEVSADVRAGVASGEIKLMTNGRELEEIRKADEEARAKLVSAVIGSVGSVRFLLDIHQGIVNFSNGAVIIRLAQPVSDWVVTDMRHKIAQCLGVV